MTGQIRIIIAGGRNFDNYELMKKEFLSLMESYDNNQVTIISGMAKGADRLGVHIATDYGLNLIKMPADWNKHGKSAGYRRNEDMAKRATHLLAFHDTISKGTKHMIDIAIDYGLVVKVVHY